MDGFDIGTDTANGIFPKWESRIKIHREIDTDQGNLKKLMVGGSENGTGM